MNPSAFMQLAERLANEPGEAELRSAVSRAYYAAFHEARLLLARCGVELQAAAEAHTKVAFCLQACQVAEVAEAATILSLARKTRNQADYQLHLTYFDPPFAALQILRYKSAIAVFQAADPIVIGPKIRDYARDILKLNVSNK